MSKLVMLDGGLYHNNPIKVADAESKAIWPKSKQRHPDIILSIGTGFEKAEMTRDNPAAVTEDVAVSEHLDAPKSLKLNNPISYGMFLYDVHRDHVMNSLPSERAWHEWLGARAPDCSNQHRYRRLNVPLKEPIAMDDVQKIDKCREEVELWSKNKDSDAAITSIAYQLLSSCFYYSFQQGDIHETWDQKYTCLGNVAPILISFPQVIKTLGTQTNPLGLSRSNRMPAASPRGRGHQATRTILEGPVRHVQVLSVLCRHGDAQESRDKQERNPRALH
jgi:hypothetical protein